jgi:ADP-ribose pyrophosphatase
MSSKLSLRAMSDFEKAESEEVVGVWQRVETEKIADCRVFQVRRDFSVDPRDSIRRDFYVIEAPDWINVIPMTADGQVILIEQYRHGSAEITLEIPGGMVDEGESPATAAARELFEETGSRAGSLELLGRTRPNPAIMNNFLHIFIARDCVFTDLPKLDPSEQISVRLVQLSEISSLIRTGVIDHALVVAAFCYLYQKGF